MAQIRGREGRDGWERYYTPEHKRHARRSNCEQQTQVHGIANTRNTLMTRLLLLVVNHVKLHLTVFNKTGVKFNKPTFLTFLFPILLIKLESTRCAGELWTISAVFSPSCITRIVRPGDEIVVFYGLNLNCALCFVSLQNEKMKVSR